MFFYFKKLTAQLIKLWQIGEKATTKPDRLIIEVKCSLSVIKYYPIYSAGYNTVKCEVTDTHRKSAAIYLQPSALRWGNRWAHDQLFKMTSNISLIDFKFLRSFFFINNLWNNDTLFGLVLSFIQLKQTQQRNQREKLKAAQKESSYFSLHLFS